VCPQASNPSKARALSLSLSQSSWTPTVSYRARQHSTSTPPSSVSLVLRPSLTNSRGHSISASPNTIWMYANVSCCGQSSGYSFQNSPIWRRHGFESRQAPVWLTSTWLFFSSLLLGGQLVAARNDGVVPPFRVSLSPRLPFSRAVCLMHVLIFKLSPLLPQIVVQSESIRYFWPPRSPK